MESLSRARRALVYGLFALLGSTAIWLVLFLARVAMPLVWWLVIFFGIIAVLYGTNWLALAVLWMAVKLGLIGPPQETSDNRR